MMSVLENNIAAEEVVPFSRFGLTAEKFHRLSLLHYKMNETMPQVRSSNELPFFDWEAELLEKFFKDNSDNKTLCGLMAAMMECVRKDFLRERAEKALLFVPHKRDTIGMFY